MYETDKYIRSEKTKALISTDISGLMKRKQEIENKKRISSLENNVSELKEDINNINNKIDFLINLIASKN